MKKIKVQHHKTTIKVNALEFGESIEEKLRRVTQTNEPITNTAPLIYTERKDGVQPQYDIRTDRFDIALEAMDKVTASIQAKREAKAEAQKSEPTYVTE